MARVHTLGTRIDWAIYGYTIQDLVLARERIKASHELFKFLPSSFDGSERESLLRVKER